MAQKGESMTMSYGVPIREFHVSEGQAIHYVTISDMPATIGQQFMHDVCPCACPPVPGAQAFFAHDWERWCSGQWDRLHDLQLHALRKVQDLARADGFKRQADEQVFMDELSGENSDGIEIITRHRFTMLNDDELAQARTWWAALSDAEQIRRREHAVALREPFGIDLPEKDDDERWPAGEGWAG